MQSSDMAARVRNSVKLTIVGVFVILLIAIVVKAGSLTPSTTAGATLYTLGDIYTRLTTNATATEGSHAFTPSGGPAGTLYTLTQIYNAIPTIAPATLVSGTTYLGVAGTYVTTNLTAANVRSGVAFGIGLTGDFPSATNTLASASGTTDLAGNSTTITSSNGAVEWWDSAGTRNTATLDLPATSTVCANATVNGSSGTIPTASEIRAGTTVCGVAGTMLLNLFNGSDTGGSFPGGSQASGGVDDGNNAGSPASGRYAGSWTACTSGNNYCGTGSSIADARDDVANLVWSLPCNNDTCTTWGESGPQSDITWSASAAQGNVTASVLCSNQSGWALPHLKQLLQAYINGAYGNLVEQAQTSQEYFSATTVSFNTGQAWSLFLSIGQTVMTAKTAGRYLRCVRAG